MAYKDLMKCSRLINILWLVPCLAVAGKPNVLTDDLLQRLKQLQSNPQVSEVLGKDGRVSEVVVYDAGLMVLYKAGEKECVGKSYYNQELKHDIFEGYENCRNDTAKVNAASVSIENVKSGTDVSARDFQRFISAVSYVDTFNRANLVQPAVEKVLAVRSEGERVIISYRSVRDSKTCWFAIVPQAEATAVVSIPQRWRMIGAIACDTQ